MLAELVNTTMAPRANECVPGHSFELNTIEVADFLAGFVHGFTGQDHKAYFESCIKDTPALEADVCTAVQDFYTKDNQKVLQGVQLLLKDLPEVGTMLAACPDAQADIATTEGWFKFWRSQGEMKVY